MSDSPSFRLFKRLIRATKPHKANLFHDPEQTLGTSVHQWDGKGPRPLPGCGLSPQHPFSPCLLAACGGEYTRRKGGLRGQPAPYRQRFFLSPKVACFLRGGVVLASGKKKTSPCKAPRTPAKGAALCHPICGPMFPTFALCHEKVQQKCERLQRSRVGTMTIRHTLSALLRQVLSLDIISGHMRYYL